MKKQTISVSPGGAGYTIIEVIIFLAISAFIMAAAMNMIKGKQAETDFTQKIRDTQSQLQSWINSSTSGFTGADPTKQYCQLIGPRPEILVRPAGMTNYTPQCVYLGLAIQFPPDSSKGNILYAYPVFGVRLSGGALPANLKQSNPTPAVGIGGGQGVGSLDLMQQLNLQPLYVYSVKSSGVDSSGNTSSNTTSHLVGFYGSINTDQQFTSGNGESDVNAYQYAFSGTPYKPADQGGLVLQCLEMTACNTGSYPDKLNKLDICLSDGVRYAQMLINSSYGIGANVTLNYLNSSANC